MIPTRVSSICYLARCPGFVAFREAEEDSSSWKADTGTYAGRVIQLAHETGDYECACRVAREEMKDSLADFDAAETRVSNYWFDSRNHDNVDVSYFEEEVELELPAAPEDPTGKPIKLSGHVDQIREESDGQLYVWDVKNGDVETGEEMLLNYAWQLSAYAIGATAKLGRPVLPGGIIRLKGYQWSTRCRWDKNDPSTAPSVFFHAGWSIEQCLQQMCVVAQHVAWLRMGLLHLNPGKHCLYCPGRPFPGCWDECERLQWHED